MYLFRIWIVSENKNNQIKRSESSNSERSSVTQLVNHGRGITTTIVDTWVINSKLLLSLYFILQLFIYLVLLIYMLFLKKLHCNRYCIVNNTWNYNTALPVYDYIIHTSQVKEGLQNIKLYILHKISHVRCSVTHHAFSLPGFLCHFHYWSTWNECWNVVKTFQRLPQHNFF